MSRSVLRRTELMNVTLDFGGAPIDLADYATTGLRIVAIGPSGIGKTNTGLLCAEQLARQGWVCVLVDPEGEIESMYGEAVANVEALEHALLVRDKPFVVVAAHNAAEFIPYAQAIFAAADRDRKPIFAMVDEGQLFSTSKKRRNNFGEASDLVNEFVERGRKRGLDLFLTANGFTGTLHRSVFRSKNLTLIGRQEDPTVWSALAPQFKASRIDYNDLSALAPGEFYCFSRRGVDKFQMPMAQALAAVAPKATVAKSALPATFTQWDRAMCAIPTPRLEALTDPIVSLLGTVAGLSSQQMLSGGRALADELEARA